MPPAYYNRFTLLAQDPDYRFRLLVDDLEFENGRLDRLKLFEDILTENVSDLKYIFKEERDYDLSSIAFSELTSLPVGTIRYNTPILESIFVRALNNLYGATSSEVINKIRILFGRKSSGLRLDFVAEKIFDPNLSIPNKIRLSQALSEIDNPDTPFEWDEHEQNLKNEMFLIPGYMYYFHKEDPLRSYKVLTCVDEPFVKTNLEYFSFPCEITIEQLGQTLRRLSTTGAENKNFIKQLQDINNAILSPSVIQLKNDRLKRDETLSKFMIPRSADPGGTAEMLSDALEDEQNEFARIDFFKRQLSKLREGLRKKKTF